MPDSLKPESQISDLLVLATCACARRVSKNRNRKVQFRLPLFLKTSIVFAAALAVLLPRAIHAEARLLIDADTGKVLEAENATVPWYPASLSKLMTAYVTLQAVKDGKITLDTLFTVSPMAA